MERIASRRAVIAGASMAAGVTAAAMWWPRGAGILAADDAVTVVAGGEAAMPAPPVGAAAAHVEALVGQSVRIANEAGAATATIAAVQLLPTRGHRPAGVRAAPFAITFLTDRAAAPVDSALYAIGTRIDGLDRLFMVRGADRGDKATLRAVFN